VTVAARLAERVLVGDGGMGSLLSLELPELRFPEEANLSAPGGGAGRARRASSGPAPT
jgi:methionine synthase I (cobalamin-dependent)